MTSSIRVGIVGYGNAAKTFHLPFISAVPAYEVVAILQRAEAPADPLSAAPGLHCTIDYPKVRHYRTPESFFADADIDFVVVATHTDSHAEFAIKALEAGKHGRYQGALSLFTLLTNL
jgi:predicted dehydrogenase